MEPRNNNGTFKSGHPGFKKKGSINKIQTDIREKLGSFIEGKLDTIEDLFQKLPDREKGKFLLECISFLLPKQREISMEVTPGENGTDLSSWNDEDLRALIHLHEKNGQCNGNN